MEGVPLVTQPSLITHSSSGICARLSSLSLSPCVCVFMRHVWRRSGEHRSTTNGVGSDTTSHRLFYYYYDIRCWTFSEKRCGQRATDKAPQDADDAPAIE